MLLTSLLSKMLRWLLPVLVICMICGLVTAGWALNPAAIPAHNKSAEQFKPVQIPFEYDPILMPYIVVQVSINGQPPLPFVVDTGAKGAILFIEPWAAKRLNLPILTINKDQFVPGQGKKTLTSTVLRTMKIAGDGKDNNIHLTFTANNKEDLKKATLFQIVSIIGSVSDYRGLQLAGIIPVDFLCLPNVIWQINFQRKRLLLIQKTKDWEPSPGSFVVPLHQIDDLYNLTAAIATGKSLDFGLDTGSANTVMNNMAAMPVSNEQTRKDLAFQAGRRYSYDTVLLPQLCLGSLIEPNVSINETDPVLNTAHASGATNLLGLDFLSRFLVTLDFSENKMYLERRSDYAQQILTKATSGVRLEPYRGQSLVVWVEPGSSAEQGGLHTGYEVKRVDGQSIQSLPLSAAQDLLDGFEGTSAKLDVQAAEGKKMTLSFTRTKKFQGRRHALLGVSLEWVQGNLMVSGVTAGSPLEGTLKWDDDIYFINGQDVTKMRMDEAFRQLERPDLALQVWRSSDKTWEELHLASLPTQTQVLVGPAAAGDHYFFSSNAGWAAIPN